MELSIKTLIEWSQTGKKHIFQLLGRIQKCNYAYHKTILVFISTSFDTAITLFSLKKMSVTNGKGVFYSQPIIPSITQELSLAHQKAPYQLQQTETALFWRRLTMTIIKLVKNLNKGNLETVMNCLSFLTDCSTLKHYHYIFSSKIVIDIDIYFNFYSFKYFAM